MITIDIASFKKRVKAILLHNMESTALEGVGDDYTLGLDGVIEQNMEHAMQLCVMLCPLRLLGGENSLIDTQEYYTQDAEHKVVLVASTAYNIGGGMVKPEGFCRYISVRSDGWAKSCMVFDEAPYAGYDIARDKLNGTLGTSSRPYARITIDENGDRVIEFYPYQSGHKVRVQGVRFEFVNDKSFARFERELCEAACWQCAYLVAMEKGFGNADRYRQESLMQMGVSAQ